jgi:hypothetical protein
MAKNCHQKYALGTVSEGRQDNFAVLHKLFHWKVSNYRLVRWRSQIGTWGRIRLLWKSAIISEKRAGIAYSPLNRGIRPSPAYWNIQRESIEDSAILAMRRSASTERNQKIIYDISLVFIPNIDHQKLALMKLNRPLHISRILEMMSLELTIATPTHMISPDAKNHPWSFLVSVSFALLEEEMTHPNHSNRSCRNRECQSRGNRREQTDDAESNPKHFKSWEVSSQFLFIPQLSCIYKLLNIMILTERDSIPSNSESPETKSVVGATPLDISGAEAAVSATTDSLDDIFRYCNNCNNILIQKFWRKRIGDDSCQGSQRGPRDISRI